MTSTRLILAFLLAAVILLPGACPTGGSMVITGQINVTRDGQTSPVADAQVRVWPKEPTAKGEPFEYEAVQNLRGVAVTRASGQFEIAGLTSGETHSEYELLKGWTYTIEVELPGYYITSSDFDYTGGQAWLEMAIEEKPVDVLDTSGGVKENEKELSRGAVRKQ